MVWKRLILTFQIVASFQKLEENNNLASGGSGVAVQMDECLQKWVSTGTKK